MANRKPGEAHPNSIEARILTSGNQKLIAEYKAWRQEVRDDTDAMDRWYAGITRVSDRGALTS